MLDVTAKIKIPLREICFSFTRSSGPGGQNVNKVNSKVVLRWNVFDSRYISEDVRIRFIEKYYRRINEDGDVVITSDRFRDQPRNVADCLGKLRSLLLDVATPPRKRVATRPSKAAKEVRLKDKRIQSEKKKKRTQGFFED